MESAQIITPQPTKYINLNINIPGHYDIDGKAIEALLKHQTFVVDNLRAKILIKIDGHIGSCSTSFELSVAPLTRPFVKQGVVLEKLILVPSHAQMAVLVASLNLPSSNYMFEPVNGCPVALFATLVDSLFHVVLAHNDFDQPVHLPSKLQVELVMDLEVDECFHLEDSKDAWATKAFAMFANGVPQGATTDWFEEASHKELCAPMKTVLPNGVTIYRIPQVAAQLATVVEEFAKI